MISLSPSVKLRPSVMAIPVRTWKALGVTPRTVTLVGWPSAFFGRLATMTISGEARGWPSTPRATRLSTSIRLPLSRLIHDVSSEPDPRWTTMPLSAPPVARSARRKPAAIARSTTNTVTTSPTPKIARSVTFQRTKRLRML